LRCPIRKKPAARVATIDVVFGDVGTSHLYVFSKSLVVAGFRSDDKVAISGVVDLPASPSS